MPTCPLPEFPAGFQVEHEFPILRHWDFYNHAGVAPLSNRAAEALQKYTAEARDHAYLTGRWYVQADRVRQLAAKLIGATPEEIAFVKNTSEGLAFVANGLAWNAGDEVIGTNVEYPANIYPWMDLAQRFGVKHIQVPERDGRIPIESLFAAVTSRTRMIALSHVEYASGYRNDVAAIGRFCREHDILFCVDAIQALGVVPVDVNAMNIDFLSADGHKWLLGPEGCGFFYCRTEHLLKLRPEVGWLNVVNALEYGNYDFTLRNDARRFECGTYNIPGILAMGASLELILELGVPFIQQRLRALTGQLCSGLIEKGYRIFSPRGTSPSGEGEDSGIVSFAPPEDARELDAAGIVRDLQTRKIALVLREKRLRASPHFYNSPKQIARLLSALP
jgi:cysteine desulfurase / selenocysteine lyase